MAWARYAESAEKDAWTTRERNLETNCHATLVAPNPMKIAACACMFAFVTPHFQRKPQLGGLGKMIRIFQRDREPLASKLCQNEAMVKAITQGMTVVLKEMNDPFRQTRHEMVVAEVSLHLPVATNAVQRTSDSPWFQEKRLLQHLGSQ